MEIQSGLCWGCILPFLTILRKKLICLQYQKFLKYTNFLPNSKLIKSLDEVDKSLVYDLVINVDVAARDRVCDGENSF
jgi:hypothetical protein